MFDDEIGSLFSLLGLLEPSEYFVTVDNSTLWQKHISWAKSGGEDLRQYITQRYASSMVFLSCLLGAQINVFFNSSKEITEMRSCLATQRIYTLNYWIGVVIMSDICVTILALVNTYTLSKLIASISDSNTHAMLRSSIGSYVVVLPSRFTVAALYLFLLWIAMWIWQLFSGPIHFFMLLMVISIFFHVVIPLSAFGRLIIHTGAMGKRPVLDVELEKELLPSGLHNSLLIRAMDRKRKYSSATDQYRKTLRHNQGTREGSSSIPSSTVYGTSLPAGSHQSTSYYRGSIRPPLRNIMFGRDPAEGDDLTVDAEDDGSDSIDAESPNYNPPVNMGHRRHMTMDTVGSDNFFFPQVSILNATTRPGDIRDIVQQSMFLSASGAETPSNAQSTDVGMTSERPSPNKIAVANAPQSDITPPKKDQKDDETLDPEKTGNDVKRESPNAPETIDRPAGLQRNLSRSHRRKPSSGDSGRISWVPIASDDNQDDIHAGMRYPSPQVTNAGNKAYFASPSGRGGHKTYGRQEQQSSPTGRSSEKAAGSTKTNMRQTQQAHPLLTSHPTNTTSARPPIVHRQSSSSSRIGGHRRKASLLGFIPATLAEQELKEENAIRASLGMPLAPDLDNQERLLEEQKHMDFSTNNSNSADHSSAWLAMHQQQQQQPQPADSVRRRSASAEQFLSPDDRRSQTPKYQSRSQRNLMATPDGNPRQHRRNHSSGSFRNLMSGTEGPYGGGRNMMLTIRSHPEEEAEDNDVDQPEETTRLLFESGDEEDKRGRKNRRSDR